MAFYTDIFAVRPTNPESAPAWWVEGSSSLEHTPDIGYFTYVEHDYTMEECIAKGWYDPMADVWTRQIVEAPDQEWEYLQVPCQDLNHGHRVLGCY